MAFVQSLIALTGLIGTQIYILSFEVSIILMLYMHCLIMSFFFQAIGSNPIAQIKRGMKLEIQDLLNPTMVWLVDIIENVGGRLYLRYVGLESAGHDFWLFYLDCRLHPPGWANARKYEYKPPEGW